MLNEFNFATYGLIKSLHFLKLNQSLSAFSKTVVYYYYYYYYYLKTILPCFNASHVLGPHTSLNSKTFKY